MSVTASSKHCCPIVSTGPKTSTTMPETGMHTFGEVRQSRLHGPGLARRTTVPAARAGILPFRRQGKVLKLKSVRVTNFRSVEDSETFAVGELTCLVGKNEAGKTALLTAIYGLNPYGEFAYDRTRDYPRRYLSKFAERHPNGDSRVVLSTWELSPADRAAVVKIYGEGALTSDEILVSSAIGTVRTWTLEVNPRACLEFLLHTHGLDETERAVVVSAQDAKAAREAIEAVGQKSERLVALDKALALVPVGRFISAVRAILDKRMPKFFLTSHFDRMSGEVSVDAMARAIKQGTVTPADQIFLDFLAYAGTTLEELAAAERLEELKAKCEGASNEITDEIFEFWSQNDALQVQIEFAEGRPGDPEPFNEGQVVIARIHNSNHRVTVPLSERSAGFIWFFSFLAQFKQLGKTAGDAIILLDEPGLTLHGKAQADLLRFIEERLLPNHQVIYTTHSPFMVPSNRLSDVLIVEDVVRKQGRKVEVEGTKVRDDVLSVDKDTLFPLQGALGYDMTQSLFIGPNTLLVEGPSDILYLQALSDALKRKGRTGLDTAWTMCPTGGIDKIAPFATLFGGNRLNIAVLCDVSDGDKGKIERLRRGELLSANQVLTVADFTGKAESDVEDLFPAEVYAELLNETYGLKGKTKLTAARLKEALPASTRVVKQAEAAFAAMAASAPEFDHFTPAAWLIRSPAWWEASGRKVDEALERAEALFTRLNQLTQ
jgi:predicted ATP-dependent endonuclease of OLD family